MRAAIYVRISRDPTGQAAGVQRQEEDCRQLAAELDWDVVEVYVDNDVSATSGKPRPEYRRMLAAIETGSLDAVLIWHADRLYRRLVDLEELVQITDQHRVAIRAVRAGEIDLSTPTGRMLARIMGSVAAHEVEQRVDRWRRGWRQRRQQGQYYGGGTRTYGYDRTGQVVPDEADVVRWIAAELLAGRSLHAICRDLNAAGRRTTAGGPWRQHTLRSAMGSPRLAGLVELDGDIVGAGQWEPILDWQTWELVRHAVAPRGPRSRPDRPGRALLAGLAVCERCGTGMVRTGHRAGPRYRCMTVPHGGCESSIAAHPVEELVEAYARELLADGRVRAQLAERLSADSVASTMDELDAIGTQIAELEAALTERSGRSVRALADAIDELTGQRDRIAATLPAAPAVQVPPAPGAEWPEDPDQRRMLIRLIVAQVSIAPARRRGGPVDLSRVQIDPVRSSAEQQLDLGRERVGEVEGEQQDA